MSAFGAAIVFDRKNHVLVYLSVIQWQTDRLGRVKVTGRGENKNTKEISDSSYPLGLSLPF